MMKEITVTKADDRREEAYQVAWSMIDAESDARDAKIARLKQARLEREALTPAARGKTSRQKSKAP